MIVLGAAVLAPGVPGPALRRRLEWGLRIFGERGAGRLLVSGGVVGGPPAEAELMRDLAVAAGVPAARIVVEDRSRNTFENAIYTGAIIRREGWRHLVLVTDHYHLARALYVFRRLGLAVEGVAVPPAPGTSRIRRFCQHAEEKLHHLRCWQLFLIGAHKPIVARVWGP